MMNENGRGGRGRPPFQQLRACVCTATLDLGTTRANNCSQVKYVRPGKLICAVCVSVWGMMSMRRFESDGGEKFCQ